MIKSVLHQVGRKDGMGFNVAFNSLRHITTRYKLRTGKKFPFPSKIVPKGLTVAEEPSTALQNTAYACSDKANPLMGMHSCGSGRSSSSSSSSSSRSSIVEGPGQLQLNGCTWYMKKSLKVLLNPIEDEF